MRLRKPLFVFFLASLFLAASPSVGRSEEAASDVPKPIEEAAPAELNVEEVPAGETDKEPAKQRFRTEDIELVRNGYLLNHKGEKVTLADFKGKIVLMDFIYSDCSYGHCAYLNNKMKFIGKKFADYLGRDIQFVSISFDPEVDNVEVLNSYSKRWENDTSRWVFLTGAPGDIVDLAQEYGIVFQWLEEETVYVHSMKTILLDRSGKMIRHYTGMNYKLQEVIDDINVLLNNGELEPMPEPGPTIMPEEMTDHSDHRM